MNFGRTGASWPLWAALAIAGWGACGGGGKQTGAPVPSVDADVDPPAPDSGRAMAQDGGGGTGGAGGDGGGGGNVAPPDAPVADAPVDRGPAGDARLDASFDLPQGPQPLGASCEIPGGGMLPCAGDLLCCKPCCDGRPAVCTRPVQNAAGIGNGKCPLPDLTVDAQALRQSLGVGPMTFSPSSCEAREACIDAPGSRNALHFEVTTPNIGSSDLVLGSPLAGGSPLSSGFVFSRCHEHYHFSGYALYQLIAADGTEVLKGKKRAFCLEDYTPLDTFPLPHSMNPKFDCDYQGISVGWADTYYNGLVCQFMDISGVKPGQYRLRVTVNPDKIFPELTYDNNSAEVPITIPGPTTAPTESCEGQVPGLNRECGWRQVGSYDCKPGDRVTVGCGTECGLGTSSGDPMIRVCEGNDPCEWPGLGSNDDCTTSQDRLGSRVTVLCPMIGRITVLAGPAYTGDQASCNVEVR